MTTDTVNALAGCRVLIIEDESLLTMLLQDFLEDMACEVAATASRFPDALAKAQSLSFDVAILDVNLDGDQTFPIAERLRDRGIPYLFATGYGNVGIPEHLRVMPVLQKPFRRSDLELALQTALNLQA